ncbi:tape measure protein [Neisseria sicca]|uniref:tape measure protein n=1 Tax=Neisseria sicca TaxID=490 RepID=UPI003D34A83F
MGGRMNDLETKIKITVENGTAAGFNQAANSAANASKQIENAIGQVRSELTRSFSEMQKSMEKAFDIDMSDFVGGVSDGKEKVSELNAELAKTGDKAEEAAGGLGKIGTLLAGFASVSFAKSLLDTADAMQSINSQVRQVVSSESEYLAVQRQLLDVANNTRASLESTSSLYVSTSRALKDYGYTQQEILQFTEATNNAMTIGGVAAQQQAAALMQLSQALGSGVLQGDEFKSIAEAAPILLDTIAEYMGKSRAEIKKLGSEGELTANVLFKAISGASEKFGEQAAKMPMTMGQALTVFQNNWQSMISRLLNDSGAMSGIASIIKLIADNLNLVVPIMAGFAVAVTAATAQVIGLNVAMLANPFGLIAVAIGAVIGLIAQFGDQIDIFGGGWSNLLDVIQAVWQTITETIGAAIEEIKAWFGGVTDWLNENVGGWSALFSRVMSTIATVVGAYVNAYINTFATGWMLIKEAANNMPQFFANLGKAIGNVFISAIEWMVNRAVGMINSMIDYANKAASMVGVSGIDKLNNVQIGRMDDGGLGGRISDSMSKDRVGNAVDNIKARAALIHEQKAMRGGGGGGGSIPKSRVPSGGGGSGGGGSGRKGGGRKGRSGGGHAGAAKDPMQAWEEEIKAQKLAHREMQRDTLNHQEWDLAREAAYWRAKLATVDAGSKTGLKLREKILTLEDQLSKQSTEAKINQVAAWEKLDKHKLDMEKDAADQALAAGRISQLERLDLEIEFENRRYQIAYDALQERIALAEQDPTYSQSAIDKLKQQMAELGQGHEREQTKNQGKRENQRRKDTPNVMEMLQDGGKNVWQEAQQQMGQAFSAMLSRTQNFRTAMNNFFKSMGQTFIQEMVTKPLAGMMQRMVQESAIYKMIFGTKETLETAAAAKTAATKATETTAVVGSNAVQAASGAAASQASIPYVGPILAVAAMAAMMAAVMGLMGGGGSSTTTTTTRIPSAAGGWDIPAGINPLTQLHENEMVLPAEHAQTIREMAGQSGGDNSTIIINTTGGDFVHKKDIAKLLKQMNRDFKLV